MEKKSKSCYCPTSNSEDEKKKSSMSRSLKIYTRQKIQDSDSQPVVTLAPNQTYTIVVPVNVHQGTSSLAATFTWGDTAAVGQNTSDISLNILRDGLSITKGQRIVYQNTFTLSQVSPFIGGRSFIFSDKTHRGPRVYTLLFTNSALSTVSILVRVINFTVTC